MTLLKIVSDLHLDYSRMSFQDVFGHEDLKDYILILPGDLCSIKHYGGKQYDLEMHAHYLKFMETASTRCRAVIFVPGNHDFWGCTMYRKFSKEEGYDNSIPYWILPEGIKGLCFKKMYIDSVSHLENVHVLVGADHVDYDDHRFIGATMWTDLFRGNPMAELAVKDRMNDFERIKCLIDYGNHQHFRRYIKTSEWKAFYEQDLELMQKAVTQAKVDGKKVMIVNHMAPSHQSIHPDYIGDPSNAAYHMNGTYQYMDDNDCIVMIAHGHIHWYQNYELLGAEHITVVCNPLGYHFQDEHQETNYQPRIHWRI